MKENIKRVRLLSKFFNLEDYYSISITESFINLQGKYNPELLVKLKKYKFKLSVDTNGYIKLNKGIYEITLTN